MPHKLAPVLQAARTRLGRAHLDPSGGYSNPWPSFVKHSIPKFLGASLMDWFVRARARGRMGPNERACTCAFMAGENGEHGVGGGSRGFMLAAYKGMCYDDVWFSKGPPPVPISTPRHPRKLDTKRLRYMCPWFTPGIERGAPLVRSPCCRSTCRPCTIHHRTPCRPHGLATRRFWWAPVAVAMYPGRSAFTARGAHMFAGMLVACCQCDHPPARSQACPQPWAQQ